MAYHQGAALTIGNTAAFQKTITETDVYLYAGITGDVNPAHINEVISKESIFKGRIAHGMLTAGLVSAVLGVYLPGPGTIYLTQELKFTAPVHFGDTVEARATIVEIDETRRRVTLETICTNQNQVVVLKGFATVKPPEHLWTNE